MPIYSEPEEVVRQGLINLNVLDLNENTCGTDLDTVYASIKEQNKTFGCLLIPGGGARDIGEPIRGGSMKPIFWIWKIFGFILIKFENDSQKIEDDARIVYDTLGTFLENDHTLGGKVDLARVVGMDKPEGADIQDDSFYWIGFVVEIKTRAG